MAQIGYAPPSPYYPGAEYPTNIPTLPSQGPVNPYGRMPSTMDPNYRMGVMVAGSQPSGMFTRNLIGSTTVSAFRLTDPDDKIGIWFILQDLSVRTEGHFR